MAGPKAEDPLEIPPASAAPDADGRRRWPDLHQPLALLVAASVLFPTLATSGIWDPYELDTAELARRVSVQVWGASLEIPGAQNGMPTLTDLEMGELPFTSMALGFKLFGLHDWSGRLPLACWGFLGVLVVYHFLARLVDRRAGLYGAVALVTMPLYFMQARTMLGDIVTMVSVAMAFCGLTAALFDGARAEGRNPLARAAWLGVALVGLAAGYLSRGLIVGIAAPALGAGLAFSVARLSRPPGRGAGAETGDERTQAAVGMAALVLGGVALALGVRAFASVSADLPVPRGLGFALLKKPPTEATFDLGVRQLGHGLFPWSAFLPFAIGRLFRAPLERTGAARERETGVRAALLVGVTVTFVASALLAPHTGAFAFPGTVLLAAIAAIAIADLERGAAPSRGLSLGFVLLAFVLYRDFTSMPEKALSVFVVDKPTFPKSFEVEAKRALQVAALGFAALVCLAWFERQPVDTGLRASLRRRSAQVLGLGREVTRAFGGNLVFSLIVLEAALIGLGAMLFVGRRLGWAALGTLGKNFVDAGLNAWWVAPPLLALAVPLAYAARDLFSAITTAARLPRAAWVVLAGLLAGGTMSFWYYPALAAQLSPKDVFETYGRLGAGEPLGLVGVRNRTAAYYHAGEIENFNDATRAFGWLIERPDQRRWLIAKADDLTRLNSLYRKHAGKNLPVLDGRSSQILLVSNQLGDRPNQNSISSMVLDDPPRPSHVVDAQFEDQLEVIGWDVTNDRGEVQASVVPQTSYHMRFYYRVLRPITGSWKAFLHIDGQQRRFNGDHAVLDGKYPMSLWQPGDVIVDDFVFQLEPNFMPGDYGVFFGFFTGETRFRVTRGTNHENRVNGGALRVR